MCFQRSPAVMLWVAGEDAGEVAAEVAEDESVAKSIPKTARYSAQSMVVSSASFTVLFRSSARRVVSKLRKNSRYSLSVCGTEFADVSEMLAELSAASEMPAALELPAALPEREAANLPFTMDLSVAISSSAMAMSAFGHS